jgi:SPP1 family predicted phage head-tail adaptor
MGKQGFSIEAGELREPIYIQQRISVEDDGGGSEVSFADEFQTYAKVYPLSSQDRWRGLGIQEVVTHEVVVRYDAAITTKKRIRYDDRIFKIEGVLDPSLRGRRMVLGCSESVNKKG